ncbi:MAG: HAD family phosphatase [Paenibacillaceae bacterium]|nr:HAD family phosphatase [Paenibacillaceae bacterium]
MTYKMIAIDVDGTLLNDGYELTAATKQAVRAAYQAGAEIVLCTGRSPLNALPIMEQLELSGTLITHNGAVTVQSHDRSILQESAFAIAEAQRFIEYARERGIHRDMCTSFGMYIESMTEAANYMYGKYMMQPERIEDLLRFEANIVKFTVFGETELLDDVMAVWDHWGSGLAHIRSGDLFIDVMLPGVNKGTALEMLAKSRGVAREHIMAIGNYYNDVDMMTYAGLGVAMANSPEGVKQMADDVTFSNNENGVAAAIVKHLFDL